MKAQLRLQFLVLLWGFTGLFGKLITIGALPIVWYRMLIAALAIFLYIKFKKKNLKIPFNRLVQLLIVGGIVGLHWFTFYQSIKVSNVAIALSTLSLGALFTSILEPIIFKRKLIKSEIFIALIVSICVGWIFKASPEYKLGILYGIICSFLSALFSVINSILKKDVSSTNITFYEMIGGFVTINLLMLFFSTESYQEVFNVGWINLFWLLLLGTIFTAFAQIEAINLFKYFSAYTILLNVNLEPVYGIILASIFFSESEKMTTTFYIATFVMIFAIMANAILQNYLKKKSIKRLNQ